MDRIKSKDNDIGTLKGEYERAKECLVTHGISTNKVSREVSILGPSSKSKRTRPRTSEAGSSGSSGCH